MPSPLDILSSRPSRVHRTRVHHSRPTDDTSRVETSKSKTRDSDVRDSFERDTRPGNTSHPRNSSTTTRANERGSLGALVGAKNLQNASAAQRYASLKWAAKASDVQGPKTMPSKKAFTAAVHAYDKAKHKGLVRKQKLTVIDYSKSANKPRLWVIDMKTNSINAQMMTTHGSGSGTGAMARSFSDRGGSNKTSLGTYIVGRTYEGKFGHAAYVKGLERGINGHANSRTIRVHAYPNLIYGNKAATTEGCFGISDGSVVTGFKNPAKSHSDPKNWLRKNTDEDHSHRIIDMISGGSVLVAYHPGIIGKSSYLK